MRALESGQIVSAGLDVHFDEPVVNPRLAAMENVELLSHNGGASLDSQEGKTFTVPFLWEISANVIHRIRDDGHGEHPEFLRKR